MGHRQSTRHASSTVQYRPVLGPERRLTELLAEHGEATYLEVRSVPAPSLGLVAAAHGHDVQSPHAGDAVYVVVAGRAVPEVDRVRSPVGTG